MIEALWYQGKHRVLFLLLKPFSYLFRGTVWLRRWAYRCGLKTVHQLPVPVIVVGNLTVGGTGKTPMVAYLADCLRAAGYRPGIVSRGFRGKATEWPQPVTAQSDPMQVGDEPVLLAQQTGCPVVVGPNRVAAAQHLLAEYACDVLISDDGLQHHALARDMEVIVVDGQRQFGNAHCLPAGPLREPLARLKGTSFVVCNGENHLRYPTETTYFSMQLLPGEIYNVADPSQRLPLATCQKREWQAVAGIGHPERFFQQLTGLGLRIHRRPYPDHHPFSRQDIEFGQNNFVVMTEKDAVKCRWFADERHWCLPVRASLGPDFQECFLGRLEQCLSNHCSVRSETA